MSSPPIVLIHGMFMTPRCWSAWKARFEQQGHQCHALAWPGRDRSPSELRAAHPDRALGALTLGAVVEHHVAFVRSLPEPPIFIGHSMGGLVVQILLGKGLGAAGVALDSAPPTGVRSLAWSFLKSNWPVVSPFARVSEPVTLSLAQFAYAFMNGMSPEEQRAVYEAEVVPESRRVGRGPLGPEGAVDFGALALPLLLIAGKLDHIVPASLNRSNYERYRKAGVNVEFEELEGKNHYLLGQPGWEALADRALSWALESASRARRAA